MHFPSPKKLAQFGDHLSTPTGFDLFLIVSSQFRSIVQITWRNVGITYPCVQTRTLTYYMQIHWSMLAVLTPARYLPDLQEYLADIHFLHNKALRWNPLMVVTNSHPPCHFWSHESMLFCTVLYYFYFVDHVIRWKYKKSATKKWVSPP